MATLHVIDNDVSGNSFVKNDVHIFYAIRELANTYGNECVVDNWDDLMNYKQFDWTLSQNHAVTIRIDK
jgi:hypothetical protein